MKKLTYEQKLVAKTFGLYSLRGFMQGTAMSAISMLTALGCKGCGMNDRLAGVVGGIAGAAVGLTMDWVNDKIEELNHEEDRDYYVELMRVANKNK